MRPLWVWLDFIWNDCDIKLQIVHNEKYYLEDIDTFDQD